MSWSASAPQGQQMGSYAPTQQPQPQHGQLPAQWQWQCYGCGDPNHFWGACPPACAGESAPPCPKCARYGHIAAMCELYKTRRADYINAKGFPGTEGVGRGYRTKTAKGKGKGQGKTKGQATTEEPTWAALAQETQAQTQLQAQTQPAARKRTRSPSPTRSPSRSPRRPRRRSPRHSPRHSP